MLCVIAKIDLTARERLIELQQRAACFGYPFKNLYGHITLATFLGDNEEEFIASCKTILSAHRAFSVCYQKIEVLTASSIIVASPRKENDIVTIQNEIARKWAADLNDWTQENMWQPHTTLLYKPQADLHAIARVMQETFEPFIAQVMRIEFSRVNESGYEIIDSIELS